MKKRTRDANGRFANEKRKPKRHTVRIQVSGPVKWLQWRKTTNDLIDTLDRGLRKVEEKLEKGDRKPMFESLKALQGVEERFNRFERAQQQHGLDWDKWRTEWSKQVDDQDKELAARIDGLKSDFERFRTVAHERLLNLEVPENAPHEYSLSIPTDTQAIQATVEWRDKRPGMVMLHVGDFIHEQGAWCRMSTEQATQLVEALTRAIKGKLTVG